MTQIKYKTSSTDDTWATVNVSDSTIKTWLERGYIIYDVATGQKYTLSPLLSGGSIVVLSPSSTITTGDKATSNGTVILTNENGSKITLTDPSNELLNFYKIQGYYVGSISQTTTTDITQNNSTDNPQETQNSIYEECDKFLWSGDLVEYGNCKGRNLDIWNSQNITIPVEDFVKDSQTNVDQFFKDSQTNIDNFKNDVVTWGDDLKNNVNSTLDDFKNDVSETLGNIANEAGKGVGETTKDLQKYAIAGGIGIAVLGLVIYARK